MESEKGQGNPEVSKEQRLQSMLDLSSKFGGSANVPEEELTAIGYVRRTMEDGTIRLLPHERVIELTQKDPDWEKPFKERSLPFEQISVELPTTEQGFRFIPRTQSELLTSKLYDLECAFFPNWDDGTSIIKSQRVHEISPHLQNISLFTESFLQFLVEDGIDGKTFSEEAGRQFLFSVLPVRRDNDHLFDPDDPNDFIHDTFKKKYSEVDGSVTTQSAREMYDELTRLEGYFTDTGEVIKDFQRRLSQSFSLIVSYRRESLDQYRKGIDDITGENNKNYAQSIIDDAELEEYFINRGITTKADAIRYIFPKYLDHIGLSEMSAMIERSANLHTIGKSLSYMEASGSYQAEEKELKQAIKKATPEKRMTLSKRLKEIKELKKKQKQLRQGVIDYFSIPQVYTDMGKRNVKEVQDFLTAGSGESTGQAMFYLDAAPNELLDKDPGRVSGDCTAGKPLPFDSEAIPLFNVKVFGQDKEHFGNMYLLTTKTNPNVYLYDPELKKERKVWHFDAIQIPKSGIDWHEGIDKIIESLIKQAEEKGIEAITVNNELHLISNYDYIARAVESYWKEHGRKITEIDIPKVNIDGSSEFQGAGSAIVLWSKEDVFESYEGELGVAEELFNLQNEQDVW